MRYMEDMEKMGSFRGSLIFENTLQSFCTASSIAMDKIWQKFVLAAGIPEDHVILMKVILKNIPFKLPYVIKPLAGGSSVKDFKK